MVAVTTTGAGRHGNWPTYHVVAGNEGSVFTVEPNTGLGLFSCHLIIIIIIIIIFSCWPHSLELSPKFHPGPDRQCRLFQTIA